MRRTIALLAMLAAVACGQAGRSQPQAAKQSDIKTVDSADARPTVLDPPPVLTDEGPAPKPKGDVLQPDAPPPPTPQDEALRASLPFAPAIGMDPVDGSKISIRASTPVAEYKGKFFYFSSDSNKRTFMSNPEQYSKGPFSHI